MMAQDFLVTCYFDPVSNICIGATLPDGEQLWLAGSSQCKSSVAGKYLLSVIVYPACDSCETFYEFHDSPLGKSAEALLPRAGRGAA